MEWRRDSSSVSSGDPGDVRLAVEHAPAPQGELLGNRWAYGIVCALLEPTTEKEWAFLRNCALNKYDDFWVDDGAVQTLRLIASPQSQQVLKEVAKVNTGRAGYIREALQYIESGPAPLSDEDAVCAGKKLAQAVKIGSWQGNKKPRFNEARDKALIDCEFVTGRDLLVQTATFHSVDGKWKLRGVRETMHATLSLKDETHGMPDAQP